MGQTAAPSTATPATLTRSARRHQHARCRHAGQQSDSRSGVDQLVPRLRRVDRQVKHGHAGTVEPAGGDSINAAVNELAHRQQRQAADGDEFAARAVAHAPEVALLVNEFDAERRADDEDDGPDPARPLEADDVFEVHPVRGRPVRVRRQEVVAQHGGAGGVG
ncbi:MAG: hypothetical protein QM754_00780 [Tepidisphaeraceae bacterium]